MKDVPECSREYVEDRVHELIVNVLQKREELRPEIARMAFTQKAFARAIIASPTQDRARFLPILRDRTRYDAELAEAFRRLTTPSTKLVGVEPRPSWSRPPGKQPQASWDCNGAYRRQMRALSFGEGTLTLFGLLLPRRLANEEIGDAVEMMSALAWQGRSSWRIYLKTVTTVFWVSLNAVREISSALLGRAKAGSKP